MITFVVGIESGLVVKFVKQSVEENVEAFRELLRQNGAGSIAVQVVFSTLAIAAPPGGLYPFHTIPGGHATTNATIVAILRQLSAPGGGQIPVLVTGASLRTSTGDSVTDGVTPPGSGGFVVKNGSTSAGDRAGILFNKNLFAHETGHVAIYQGDDNGHSTDAGNVMFGHGVFSGDVTADEEYIRRVSGLSVPPLIAPQAIA